MQTPINCAPTKSHWLVVEGMDLTRRRSKYQHNLDVYYTLLEEVHTL